MSTNMDTAISNLLTRAKDAAGTATAEELVYLSKAIEAVAPGESLNFLVQTAAGELAAVNAAGTAGTDAITAMGAAKVTAVTDAGNAKVAEVNALATNTFKTVGGESVLGSGDIPMPEELPFDATIIFGSSGSNTGDVCNVNMGMSQPITNFSHIVFVANNWRNLHYFPVSVIMDYGVADDGGANYGQHMLASYTSHHCYFYVIDANTIRSVCGSGSGIFQVWGIK